jgi:hypothetical protein
LAGKPNSKTQRGRLAHVFIDQRYDVANREHTEQRESGNETGKFTTETIAETAAETAEKAS